MPRIFDNIELQLLVQLQETMKVSHQADFCVGYFNLRGWRDLASHIDSWRGGEGNQVRLLVGMNDLDPHRELKDALSVHENSNESRIDSGKVKLAVRALTGKFREQLTFGMPTPFDEKALRMLAKQLKAGKVVIKLFLPYRLHAKLYLLYRKDLNNPVTGFVGSSNLTFSGLSGQGELNVDVLEHDATGKLSKWFSDRWNDRWCIDITEELIQIINESWAREDLISPYLIYLKVAYHLSREARHGISEFRIPKEFEKELLKFQITAVQICAYHLRKKGGVILGDVVGLGKTRMASALVKVMNESHPEYRTLILCPRNLVSMWDHQIKIYNLQADVLSISKVLKNMPRNRRYQMVLIDESHFLRNRKGKRYEVVKSYIEEMDSKCILLSATPYNKDFLDLSSQLRLFIKSDQSLGIKPEKYIKQELEGDESAFEAKFDCISSSIAAFEKSHYYEDWRELMRLFMVRRTRKFILDNYSEIDPKTKRKYLTFANGDRSYFPERVPRKVSFKVDEKNPNDPYAKLYSFEVVDTINKLNIPRYGLGKYKADKFKDKPTKEEIQLLDNLSNAGKRLMGFCRTNLLKRLESDGHTFILSIERHILRNYIYLYALENRLPIPVGTQNIEMLASSIADEDMEESDDSEAEEEETEETRIQRAEDRLSSLLKSEGWSRASLMQKAEKIYKKYQGKFKNYFDWIRPSLFKEELKEHLEKDNDVLKEILKDRGEWNPDLDEKLNSLEKLIRENHSKEKILVFTQFADTAVYLHDQLKKRKIKQLEYVTGSSDNPTESAQRFSPFSNEIKVDKEDEIRILITTDVLSEGQNLQDAHIVVNFDLPWAIIRLIQRAGRVDRIGQKADTIYCYSFFPAKGIEKIINLRKRVMERLNQNAEIVGTDERFFEKEGLEESKLSDLYSEKSGILDNMEDEETDIVSRAYQIWQKALKEDPEVKKKIEELPNVVYSTKETLQDRYNPEGVVTYIRTGDGTDNLIYLDGLGNTVTESQSEILNLLECTASAKPLKRITDHYDLSRKAVQMTREIEKNFSGALGRESSPKHKVYNRMKHFIQTVKGEYYQKLEKAVDEIYRFPLTEEALDKFYRELKIKASDQEIADLLILLSEDKRLVQGETESENLEPSIICSMGFKEND